MEKRIFYEKLGSKYRPVRVDDTALMDSLPLGYHVVWVKPNGQTVSYNIDPDHAAMAAAALCAQEYLMQAVNRAAAPQYCGSEPLTPEQSRAWENLIQAMGDSGRILSSSSAWEVAKQATKALQQQAELLLSNSSVKAAYEQFQLLVKLSTENRSNVHDHT